MADVPIKDTEFELTPPTLAEETVTAVYVLTERLILELNERLRKLLVVNRNLLNAIDVNEEAIKSIVAALGIEGDGSIVDILQRLTELEDEVDLLTQAIVALAIRVTQNENNIAALTILIDDLEPRVDQNETDIIAIQDDISNLENRVTVNEADILALQVSVLQLQVDVAALNLTNTTSEKTIGPASATYTIVNNLIHTHEVDASSAQVIVTLPLLSAAYDATAKTGWIFNIVKTDSSSNTVLVGGIINGGSNFELFSQDESLTVQASAGTWRVI